MKKEDIITEFLKYNILVTKEAIDILEKLSDDRIYDIIKKAVSENAVIINKDDLVEYKEEKKENSKGILSFFSNESRKYEENKEINLKNDNIDLNISMKKILERKEDNLKIKNEITVEIHNKKEKRIGEEIETNIKLLDDQTKKINILKKFDIQKNKADISSWVSYYKSRLNKIKKHLKEHGELKNIYALDKIPENEENIGIAGMIYDKKIKENGILYVIEDGNKVIRVFVNKNKEDIDFNLIKSIPLDSVIGFVGVYKKGMFFADQVIFPDVPMKKPKTYGNDDIYIAFTGDWQIGNKYAIDTIFDRFIKFLYGKTENEKLNELSRKIGYLSIIGDVVDGVGVYPEQEKELLLKTYEQQYQKMDEYIVSMPEDLKIAIIPGNHDIPRLAEPQPALPRSFLRQSYQLKNVYYLSNPSYVSFHDSITTLMYHGYVLDWLVSEIPILRERGGYENPGELMKFLLMLRLIAPTHGATPYMPYFDEDPLVIDDIPDIFHTGHIHRASYDTYRSVDMVNSSTFQDTTPYQKELGHKPLPGIIFLRNIKDGSVLAVNLNDLTIHNIRDKII